VTLFSLLLGVFCGGSDCLAPYEEIVRLGVWVGSHICFCAYFHENFSNFSIFV